MSVKYVVCNSDVDGSSRRQYKSLAGAVKRFVEMSGVSVEAAIREHYWKNEESGIPLPKIEDVSYLRAVSMFGNVVSIERVSNPIAV